MELEHEIDQLRWKLVAVIYLDNFDKFCMV
jgi:hypothetical protein